MKNRLKTVISTTDIKSDYLIKFSEDKLYQFTKRRFTLLADKLMEAVFNLYEYRITQHTLPTGKIRIVMEMMPKK